MPGEAADVHLVDDGPRRGSFSGVSPSQSYARRIHHHAFHGRGAVVSRLAGGLAGIVLGDHDAAPIGIEQDLVGSKRSPLGVELPVRPVAIKLARLQRGTKACQ